ncbi:MAG: DUF2846 domain-containing protein [Opitutaceae bacterium]|nr:DUF2846 domain-containing protein [Opitutaceae bacterium]
MKSRNPSDTSFRAIMGAILFGGIACLFSGCASQHMTRTASNIHPPIPDKQAQIVFMRPSSFGGAIQSSLYEVRGDAQEFLGIVSAKTKLAHHVPAGEHLFMVVAENADFMAANVEAGKTYYVLVSARPGVWKARFSLIPIHNDPAEKYNLTDPQFANWVKSTHFVELLDSGRKWYEDHANNISQMRRDYMAKWDARSPESKKQQILHAKDGVETPASR